jgi:hypothetical protein
MVNLIISTLALFIFIEGKDYECRDVNWLTEYRLLKWQEETPIDGVKYIVFEGDCPKCHKENL